MVISNGKVTLADHLSLKDLPLATTPGGKAFTMKALHPSEHTIKSARVPGGNRNSVAIQADMVVTLPMPDVPDAIVRVTQSPNIAIPAMVEFLQPNYAQTQYVYDLFNPAFGGEMKQLPALSFAGEFFGQKIQPNVKEYRITSQSVTVELVAPAVADQGTIISAIYNTPSMTGQYNMPLDLGDGNVGMSVYPDFCFIETPPDDSKLILGTTAFTGKARDGVYQPLKLTSFKWRNANDPTMYFNVNNMCDPSQKYNLTPGDNFYFPFVLDGTNADPGSWESRPPLPKMCGSSVGITYLKGLSKDASVRVRMRQVVEITALPSTVYAPMLEPALPPDETALKMYFEISAKMKDGYPASYNDLGRLKDIITTIGKQVLPSVEPFLAAIPGVGTALTAAKAVIPMVKTIKDAVQKGKAAKAQPASKKK